jgi:hypothetical protein
MNTIKFICPLIICLWSVLCFGACPTADLAGDDCYVDFKDMAVLANQWLTTGTADVQHQYLAIPAAAFFPNTNNGVTYTNSTTYGASITSGSGASLNAPVYLPQGAVIESITVYCRNYSQNTIMQIDLERTSMAGDSSTIIAEIIYSDYHGFGNALASCSETVDNSSGNAYVISVGANWVYGPAIKGAVITYHM